MGRRPHQAIAVADVAAFYAVMTSSEARVDAAKAQVNLIKIRGLFGPVGADADAVGTTLDAALSSCAHACDLSQNVSIGNAGKGTIAHRSVQGCPGGIHP